MPVFIVIFFLAAIFAKDAAQAVIWGINGSAIALIVLFAIGDPSCGITC